MSDHVTLTTHPRFVLLEPKPTPARSGPLYQLVCPPDTDVTALLRQAVNAPIVAVDFETRGNDYSLPDSEAYVVGVGLAWDEGSCYLSMDQLSDESIAELIQLLTQHKGLIAHNVYFDGGWIKRDLGQHANWLACTFGLYMQCASEGFEGQRWGLKEAMVDVLMWSDTNETELDTWLVDNGYCKQNKAPMKGEMWRAPPAIIGRYCVLDAEATYLLYTEHLAPLLRRFPKLDEYHQCDFLPHVLVHIDQKIAGIMTDRQHWVGYATELEAAIVNSERSFREHPLVAPHIKEFETAKVTEFLSTEPARHKKKKERKEPPRFLKDGVTISKNWLKWDELERQPLEESKNWKNWEGKRHRIELGIEPGYSFNLQSGDHLRWLLYDKLNNKVSLQTESGLPAVSEDALQSMGDVGQILIGRALKVKELSYVADYIERVEHRPTIHPSFKMPGTVTGRLAGKSPNLQQCFAPDTEALTPSGWKLIKDLQIGELVWTIQPDTLFGQWGPVQATTQRHYSGDMVAIGMANNTPLLVTPDHRLLLIGDLNHAAETERVRRVTATASDIHKLRTKECMAHASIRPSTTTESFFSERDIWMAAAVQADGSSARVKNPYVWRFGFKRDRKIQKFTELVGVPANHVSANGVHSWYRVEFQHPLLTADKKFDLSVLGDNQVETFVEALSFWDGHKVGTAKDAFEFYCIHEDVVDAIQALLVRHGYGVRKFKRPLAYSLYIRKGSHREYKKSNVTTQVYDGMVYCLSVETEHLLVRRGTSTYVTSQCPKTRGTLSGFISRPGHSFVDCDVNALEMVVTAELSQDNNLLALYGPSAKKNDIYLFYGSMMAGIGPKLTSLGYDPYAPTAEAIEATKKAFKKERSIAKLLILSDNYGSGVKKKQKILSLNGVEMSLREVEEMHNSLMEAKSGVMSYITWLQDEWKANGGWVENGYGRPICIDDKYLKDILNRVVQSTGHDILQLYSRITAHLLTEAKLSWTPIVMDWHDESIIEVPDEQVEAAKKIMEVDAYRELNSLLGGTCPLKGSAAVAKTLAGIKLEE
jgi:hypothetical protein